MSRTLHDLHYSNSFATLGEAFYSRVNPTPFDTNARLVHFNPRAAELIGLTGEAHQHELFLSVMSGQSPLPNSDSLAMLYAGHQFGHLVPQLGDGRAILLGEVHTDEQQRWEIQLKGSGITPYSRQGDGRAVLRSTIREYLCSEAMHGLGVPTTRALCIVGSDDEIIREQIEPGAMLARMAPSHVRFGSFEVFYYRNQFEHIQRLADYVMAHHYPHLAARDYAGWLREIMLRTAHLIAQWQAVGFCHGVMNSDNMSILGLTLDYGPYGFMEAFDPNYICNHSDHGGRYAYRQQPKIGLFNLSCLAQAVLPLLHEVPEQAVEIAKALFADYYPAYQARYHRLMRDKLGLVSTQSGDESLIEDLLKLMAQDHVDYTIAFRRLCDFSTNNTAPVRDLFLHREDFDQWAARYLNRLTQEHSNDIERAQRMKRSNPKYILRNYMAEIAIRRAQDHHDYSEIDHLLQLLHRPCDEHPQFEHYAGHPPDWAGGIEVSCSS